MATINSIEEDLFVVSLIASTLGSEGYNYSNPNNLAWIDRYCEIETHTCFCGGKKCDYINEFNEYLDDRIQELYPCNTRCCTTVLVNSTMTEVAVAHLKRDCENTLNFTVCYTEANLNIPEKSLFFQIEENKY